MKKLFILSIALLFSPFLRAQNFNQGFEIPNTGNDGPEKWGPFGFVVMPTDSNCLWTGQDSMGFWSWDAHSGNRSYELRVATYCTNGYGGTLQTRMFSVDTFADERIPFTDTPDAFTFYYKLNSVGGDIVSGDVKLELTDGSLVAYGGIALSQTTSGWTMATIPMFYYDTAIPEYMMVHLYLYSDTNLNYGTRFVVDDFNMVLPTSVSGVERENKTLACYPVPAKDVVRISIPRTVDHSGKLMVIDALGKVVIQKEIQINARTIEISVTDLPTGIYSLKLSTATDIFTGRFVK